VTWAGTPETDRQTDRQTHTHTHAHTHTHTHTHDVTTIQIADFTQLGNVYSLKKCIQDISETDAVILLSKYACSSSQHQCY
jgi:hypothetical protein